MPDNQEVMMEAVLLKPEEAASYLGIGRSKVYELMKAGVIESVRIGACRRVSVQALQKYVASLPSDAWMAS